jgi:hypothetical protein
MISGANAHRNGLRNNSAAPKRRTNQATLPSRLL